MDWASTLPLAVRIRLQRVKPSTQQQYQYAFGHFARWLQDTGQEQKADAQLLDAQLVAFAEALFRDTGGRRRQTAACARLACIWLSPALKHRLPRSLAVTNVTAWNRAANRPTQSHPPIPWPLLCVIAHRFAAAGDHAMATAVVVAFAGLLRIGEVAALRVRDVAEQRQVDARLRDGLVLAVRDPKTATDAKGERQAVVISDGVAVGLLRDYLAARRAVARPTDSLFARSKQQLEREFGKAAAALGGATHFTWHSLRHGGATYLYMSKVEVEDICLHGRWRSLDGVRRYVQTGQAVVAAHGVDPQTVVFGETIAAGLRRAAGAAHPPAL